MAKYVNNLGIGVGLRIPHLQDIFEKQPKIDFFEIISENFMVDGGRPLYNLDRLLELYPIVQHGVSLSIGSSDPLDMAYLKSLKKLIQRTNSPWVSDHLCWSSNAHKRFYDLWPLPYTLEVADYIADRAKFVQEYLEVPFALENLSSYVSFKNSEMEEWEFYSYIVEKANCYMMLDVNNIYVSSVNHHFTPMDYINGVPLDRVVQVHVAGHTELENGTLLDTHNNYVRDEVWVLYEHVYKNTGGVSTILEWDEDFLTFDETHQEALKAKKYQGKI